METIQNLLFSKTPVLIAFLSLGAPDPTHAMVVDLPGAEAHAAAPDHADFVRHYQQRYAEDVPEFTHWDHVGMVGMGSGIYLGDGFVLTSAHVGCYPFQMRDGSYYKPDYRTWRVLEAASGEEGDIAVFRVRITDPHSSLAKLGELPISSGPVRKDQPVVICGAGLQQKSEPATIKVNGKAMSKLGYHIEGRRSFRFGFNTISDIPEELVRTGKERRTRCFTTSFDQAHLDAQAASGDSGGASFTFNRKANRWELTGCIIAVSHKPAYAPFGSRTFLADIGYYQDQLFPAAVPSNLAKAGPAPKADDNDKSVVSRHGAVIATIGF